MNFKSYAQNFYLVLKCAIKCPRGNLAVISK